MPRFFNSWLPRTAAGMAALGVNASLLSHVLAVGVVLLAPWEHAPTTRKVVVPLDPIERDHD